MANTTYRIFIVSTQLNRIARILRFSTSRAKSPVSVCVLSLLLLPLAPAVVNPPGMDPCSEVGRPFLANSHCEYDLSGNGDISNACTTHLNSKLNTFVPYFKYLNIIIRYPKNPSFITIFLEKFLLRRSNIFLFLSTLSDICTFINTPSPLCLCDAYIPFAVALTTTC